MMIFLTASLIYDTTEHNQHDLHNKRLVKMSKLTQLWCEVRRYLHYVIHSKSMTLSCSRQIISLIRCNAPKVSREFS